MCYVIIPWKHAEAMTVMDAPRELDWSDPEVRRLNCSSKGREVLHQSYLLEGIGLWLLELEMEIEYGTYLSRLRPLRCVFPPSDDELNSERTNWHERKSLTRALTLRREAIHAKLNEDFRINYHSVRSGLIKASVKTSHDIVVWIFKNDDAGLSGELGGRYDPEVHTAAELLALLYEGDSDEE